ncbi:hypothetical protein CNBE0770 [Cryptococcus deneoformans B-3501A]|uniref:hypothetical protein n=1 Tax=Cryptococcus deneoformans (strain B-3501A) TaxID=283643 RepID=UPI000042D5AC|nr:hypothetical protein CNBE0770 [Cryptococcus neoformans var. neoformans B-3501A]EAL20712.1 hypothetical protein CNBE0770 [Cryptococcus neoformans var. neoformans B-3501A]
MGYRLIASGDRPSFTVIEFDPAQSALKLEHNYPAPHNCSWLEKSPFRQENDGTVDKLFALSEGDEKGELFTFELHGEDVKITSREPTLGAPAQFQLLSDRSAVVLATYLGGSLALYPLSANGTFASNVKRTEITFDFTYSSHPGAHGPVPYRQKQCHAHQVLEHQKTGSPKSRERAARGGWVAPPAPRLWTKARCVFERCRADTYAATENLAYVICELSHQVHAFPLPSSTTENVEDIQPLSAFSANVIPPNVPLEHQTLMDSSEIWLHPTIPNVIYASNRWQLHIAERQPESQDVAPPPKGDSLAIILLNETGDKVESVKHVETGLDAIRGFRVSPDGKYVAVAGQEGGGVEVYGITGSRGDEWDLIARLGEKEGVERGIKDVLWL